MHVLREVPVGHRPPLDANEHTFLNRTHRLTNDPLLR
jgi:hypothetical protein